MPRGISKSEYLKGRQCKLALWFYRNRKDLRRPPDAVTKEALDFGTHIGAKAQELFPSGRAVSVPPWQTSSAVAQTQQLIRSGANVIFEACAQHPIDNTHARIDILLRDDKNKWQLHEVKATRTIHTHHIEDLAFQWYVFRAAKYSLASAHVIHLKQGLPDDYDSMSAQELFVTTDLTEAVLQKQKEIFRLSFELGAIARQPSPPECPPGPHCVHPFVCEFRHYCWQNLSPQERSTLESSRNLR